MNMSRKRPEPAWLNTTSHLTEEPEHTPGPWKCGQHTPGPWRSGDMFNTIFGPPNGNPAPKIIATVHKGNRGNARLIAAAPELLGALKSCFAMLTSPKFAGWIKVNRADDELWAMTEAMILMEEEGRRSPRRYRQGRKGGSKCEQLLAR